jgi:hypothetical protein
MMVSYTVKKEVELPNNLVHAIGEVLRTTVLRDCNKPAKVVWCKFFHDEYGLPLSEAKALVDKLEAGF